jgi:hypothetical protein
VNAIVVCQRHRLKLRSVVQRRHSSGRRVARRAAAAVRVDLTSQPVVRCDVCHVPLPSHPLVSGVATLADVLMRRAWALCRQRSHHYTCSYSRGRRS